MKVLHAIWGCNSDNKHNLYIWAEPSSSFSKRETGKGRKQSLHPFVASKNDLEEWMKDFSLNIDNNSTRFEKIKIRLPVHNKIPVPSPWLFLDEDHIDATKMSTWNVTTSTLNPFQSFDFLLKLPEKANLPLKVQKLIFLILVRHVRKLYQ